MTAAFFNRTDNALFLYDLSSKKLTRKSPYQSRALPVKRRLFLGWKIVPIYYSKSE